ncbi:hypothetical protein LJC25_00820 [Bacteroidales bacterium OttesenSCG-928-K03]|nr:hypothetical protein [Odoribacter sp. OttesenSCG-928-L07]MDL2239122.1 hypothetical protein [Bacteroidales bacterium OttesenSCG-928-L14]MDL2240035.1 hypothetical protein [Bacteroidales bacterium OttesenSCG-928-K22]MDL2242253.1 hypothetical protein [Bacteroidales bacterium OttesenSCG-928-K03]
MKKIFLFLTSILAITFLACNSNNDSVNDSFVAEKSRGPLIISYAADTIICIEPKGKCIASMIINFDDDKSSSSIDNESNVIAYNTLRLYSENHEGDDLINFPEIYYDAKMTGIGVGIYIPEQTAGYIEETNEYILKFLYR